MIMASNGLNYASDSVLRLRQNLMCSVCYEFGLRQPLLENYLLNFFLNQVSSSSSFWFVKVV